MNFCFKLQSWHSEWSLAFGCRRCVKCSWYWCGHDRWLGHAVCIFGATANRTPKRWRFFKVHWTLRQSLVCGTFRKNVLKYWWWDSWAYFSNCRWVKRLVIAHLWPDPLLLILPSNWRKCVHSINLMKNANGVIIVCVNLPCLKRKFNCTVIHGDCRKCFIWFCIFM